MIPSAITTTLLACLVAIGRASPIARNNDGPTPKPIVWTSPSGEKLCWQPCKEHPSAGQTLVVAACQSDSPIQQFIYNPGPTSIRLKDTDLCVEFGPGLGRNGTPLRLQKCRANGAPGQRLFITEDRHVALQNGPGQCADVRDGKVIGGKGELQSWRCVADNTNQIFSFEDVPPKPDPEPVPPLGAIQFYGNDSLCLTVAEPGFESGLLDLETCGSVPTDRQRFWLPADDRGNITLQDTSTGAVYCIDFGNAVITYPLPTGAPILFAPCEAGRTIQQDNFAQFFVDPAVSLEQDFVRFQNWATALFVNVVQDAQAGTGYRVETLNDPFGFVQSEYFIYPAPPAEPNPNPPAGDEGGGFEYIE